LRRAATRRGRPASQQLADFITRTALAPGEVLQRDEPLLADGILDSPSILHLVAFIEDEHAITEPDASRTPEHLQDVSHLARLVAQLKAASGVPPLADGAKGSEGSAVRVLGELQPLRETDPRNAGRELFWRESPPWHGEITQGEFQAVDAAYITRYGRFPERLPHESSR